MKGDLSRRTFQAAKHYHGVQMQQGRVQLDADWNEQVDITTHRVETEAIDVIGDAGGPQAAAGFAITRLGDTDFQLGAGRYYVDGILVINEAAVAYTAQDDHPGRSALVAGESYLVYLDVWQRHVTHLDDPYLREVALGGPDTATRARTVWQVKVAGTEELNCLDAWGAFFPPLAPSGTMRAGTTPVAASSNPCLVHPTAGYRGLENQLYRIEIHRPGAAFDLAPPPAIAVNPDPASRSKIIAGGGTWAAGDAVQITSTAHPEEGPVFLIRSVSGATLELHAELRDVSFTAATRIRKLTGALFKWSRDNGAIATRLRSIDATRLRLEVESLGPDDVLGFRDFDLVELYDDRDELGGPGPAGARPGELLQIKHADPATNTIELVAPTAFSIDTLKDRHPKLRRWHGLGAVVHHSVTPDLGWVELELGLRVRFGQAGAYRTGDYWQVAARASNANERSGNIEWPYADPDQPPSGIAHHFCPLGLIDLAAPDPADQVKDCRSLFPPLTELKRFFFVGGDGQEVMPDLTAPGQLVALPHELVVGVANGLVAVAGARVEFEIVEGEASLGGDQIQAGAAIANGPGGRLIATTGTDGMARCTWRLRGPRDLGRQVRARLLDATDDPVAIPPILFGAGRSVARQVAFLPPAGCASLAGSRDVQAAIEALAHVRSLSAAGGDGQDGLPGGALALPIEVEVRDHCGPIAGARVRFAVATGGLGEWPGDPTVGAPASPRDVATDAAGRARVFWRLGPARGPQEATATLLDGPSPALAVRFTANATAFDGCGELVARSAQELIDIFATLPPGADAHICIAPGRHAFAEPLVVVRKGHLKISGAGDATVLVGATSESVLRFETCASVTIRDLRVIASATSDQPHEGGALDINESGRVTLEHLRVEARANLYRASACISVRAQEAPLSVRIRSCDLAVGDGQIGIRVINAQRAEIEDNTLRVGGKALDLRERLRHGGRYLDEIHKFFMHPTLVQNPQSPPPAPPELPIVRGLYVTSLHKRLRAALGEGPLLELVESYVRRAPGLFSFPELQLRFDAPLPLREIWPRVLTLNPLPPGTPPTRGAIKDHLCAISTRIINDYLSGNDPPFQKPFRDGLDRLAAESRPAGAQGIVVAGRVRGEARILNNTVEGFRMGIHVGHSETPRRDTFRSARTLIGGNTIVVRVNGEHWTDRHGVFSGNSENTLIEDNNVTADRSPMAMDLPLEGYRVHGIFGPMLKLYQNQATDCTVGIRVRALNPASQPASVWRVHDNAVRGTLTPLDIVPPMP